jgi:hypothetical protein
MPAKRSCLSFSLSSKRNQVGIISRSGGFFLQEECHLPRWYERTENNAPVQGRGATGAELRRVS